MLDNTSAADYLKSAELITLVSLKHPESMHSCLINNWTKNYSTIKKDFNNKEKNWGWSDACKQLKEIVHQ